MTKRLLVALLVAMVVVGTVSTAFAASFSDTKGTKYESAVGVLSSLGILNGFPDGTFKPGDTVTRAQFAKVAVCALGLENAAEYAQGVTMFSDVPATHWASGYINIAADQGLIKGYEDGTFKPEAPVKYSEAMAIIVRVLGYDPTVKGTWPTNYLVKAAEIGVSSGLSFAAGAPATRGDVSLMLENGLDIFIMVQTTHGDLVQYEVSEETLLDKMGYESDSGTVTDTPVLFDSALDEDEVKIEGGTFTLAEGLNLDAQLGLDVKFWFDAGEEIIYATTVTDSDDIVTGVIADIDAAAAFVKIGAKKYYPADPDEPFWCVYNLTSDFDTDTIDADDEDFVGAEATLILDDGDIVGMLVMQFDFSGIIASVDTKWERWYVWEDDEDETRFKYDDYEPLRIYKDGKAIEYGDLEKLDVVHWFEAAEGLYMEVFDEKVSGEVDEVSVDASDSIIVTIDGDDYALAGDATLSTDENDTIEPATEAGMEDFVGNDVTLYLNHDADARHIVGDFVVETASNIAVVRSEFYNVADPDPTEDDQYLVKFFLLDESLKKYDITEDTEFDGTAIDTDLSDIVAGNDWVDDAYPEGSIVEYTLDSDGALATVDAVPDDESTGALDESEIDADAKLILGERATSGTKIIEWSAPGEFEVIPWDTFKTAAFSDVCDAWLWDDGDATIEYLVFDSSAITVDYDIAVEDFGVVLSRRVTADGTAVKILVEDEQVTYLTGTADLESCDESNDGVEDTDGVWSDIDVGDLVIFTTEEDEFTAVDEMLADEVFAGLYSYYVEDIDEADLILTVRDEEDPEEASDPEELLLSDECVIYDVTGTPVMADLDDLAVDQVVQAFDLDADGLIDVIKILE